MKNTRRMHTRIGALVMGFVMLCCLLLGTVTFSSAETEKKTFSVDFADLAAKVDTAAYVDGVYTPAETDADLDAWVLEKFALTNSREGHTFVDRTHLGTHYDNSSGNPSYFSIAQNGYLLSSEQGGGEAYRTMQMMTVKDASGEFAVLDNFEAKVVFQNTTFSRGAVAVFFNEQTPGKMAFGSWTPNYLNQDAVFVGLVEDSAPNGGITVKGSGDALSTNGIDGYIYSMKENFDASKKMTSGADAVDHEMTVKVIGNDVYVKVTTPSTGAVLWEKTYAGAVKGTDGTVSIGAGRGARAIKSIEIKELDANGNQVDFGTYATGGADEEEEPITVNQFKVDFADLAAKVDAAAYVDGVYTPAETDADLDAWVLEKFALTNCREGHTFVDRTHLGTHFDNGSGNPSYFSIAQNGYLLSSEQGGGEAYRTMQLMTVKDASGEFAILDNFEARIVFQNTTFSRGAVAVFFNEQTPGQMAFGSWTPNYLNQDAVFVGLVEDAAPNGGITVKGSGENLDNAIYAMKETFSASKALTSAANAVDHEMIVKVIGNDVYVKVTTPSTGAVLWEKTYSNAVKGSDGTVSIGAGRGARAIKSVTITELDENGVPVDFGTYGGAGSVPEEEEPITVEQLKVDFADLAALVNDADYVDGVYTPTENDAELDAWVLQRFGMMYNREGQIFTERKHLGTMIETEYGNGPTQWLINKDGYLQKLGTKNQAEPIRDMEFISVKGADGEYVVLDNFEARIVFKNIEDARGVVMLSFNEEIPGIFGGHINNNPNCVKQDAVMVGILEHTAHPSQYSGITVKSYDEAISPNYNDGYMYVMKEQFASRKKMTAGANAVDHELRVKVIGSDIYVKVTTPSTGKVLWEKTYAGAAKGTTGTVSVGVGKTSRAIKSITITELDEDGVPVDFQKQEDNTAKVNGNTITVKAGEGYELKAGSLVVTDAKGEVFIPKRVGYREGGEATRYTIPASAVAPFEVDYEFIQPGDEDGYNVGFMGTSVNPERGGLRFINRFQVDEDGNMLYNGEKVAVKEYGMLIASAAILPNAADLDIETAADSMHVHQFKWPASNRYYDKCDDYVDIAVQVNNIPTAAADMDIHTRAYMILADDTVAYMDVETASYEEASDVYTTERVVDLLASNQMRTIGRSEITEEKVVMGYNNVAVTFSGELEGGVSMRMVNTSAAACIVHVIVDGNVEQHQKITLPGLSSQGVLLCADLEKGYHTIEVIRGTCTNWRDLELHDLTYKGTLTTPESGDLRIEVLGDSITCANGSIFANGSYQYGTLWQDGFYSYAAIAGRNLDAETAVLSISGITTPQMCDTFNNIDPDYFAENPQDIVVINLGTNDVYHKFSYDQVIEAATNMINSVRDAYGEDTYVVWAYGMMTTDYIQYYKDAVANFNDPHVLFCDLSPSCNSGGTGGHPTQEAQAYAGEILTEFLQKNCL